MMNPVERASDGRFVKGGSHWSGDPVVRQSVIKKIKAVRAVKGQPNKRGSNGKLRGRKWPAAVVERRAEPMRGRPQKALLTKKGPLHCVAVSAIIRSPWGSRFEIRNITHFVLEHPEFFKADANPAKRLLTLVTQNRAQRRESWKGWTARRI